MSKLQYRVCFAPYLRVFHTKSQFSDQHLPGKIRHNCEYSFPLRTDVFEYQYVLYKRLRGCGFYERGRDKLKVLLNILSNFDVFWTTKERTGNSIVESIRVSRVHDSLKCHRNVTKQTNPLQLDDLVTNKSAGILEASRRILNTQCVEPAVHANVKR